MEHSILSKCQCGGDIQIFNNLYECKECKAKVWKYSFGREFKDKEAKKLLSGETCIFKGFKSSNNTLYDTTAFLEDGELKLLFDDNTKSTTMFKCQCKGDVIKINKGYKCQSCEKIVWEQFMNKLLTFRQIRRLFKGDSLELHNLKSQRGNIFNAEIFYTNNDMSFEYI